MSRLHGVCRQRLVVVRLRGIRVQGKCELILPAELESGRKGMVCLMVVFLSTMRGMDKIAFNHSSDVSRALLGAKRSTQARQARAFNRVGGNIRCQINLQSPGLTGN